MPIGNFYNQSRKTTTNPAFLNTANAFSPTYNNVVIALMKLQVACEENAFTAEQKSIIAGWLDDAFEYFPVGWRELPLALSPDVKRWKIKACDKCFEPRLKSNRERYMQETKREQFIPPWMNKEVNGLDLGDVYLTYYSLRNSTIREGEPITAKGLSEREPGLNDWLVAFKHEEYICQESDISEVSYNSMSHRLSLVDKEIAAITTPVEVDKEEVKTIELQPQHKFSWTGLEVLADSGTPEVESSQEAGSRFSRSDSSRSIGLNCSVKLSRYHEDYRYITVGGLLKAVRKRSRLPTPDKVSGQEDGKTLSPQPEQKRQKVQLDEMPSTSGEVLPLSFLPECSGPVQEAFDFKIQPGFFSVKGLTLMGLGLGSESDLYRKAGDLNFVGKTAIKYNKDYQVSGAGLMQVLELTLNNMTQPESSTYDKDGWKVQLEHVQCCLEVLKKGLEDYCKILSNVFRDGVSPEALEVRTNQMCHAQEAVLELDRLAAVISSCQAGGDVALIKDYLNSERTPGMHEHIKAVFDTELRQSNWFMPLQPSAPKLLNVDSEQSQLFSESLRQKLPQSEQKEALIDHFAAVRLLVKELPGVMKKCSQKDHEQGQQSALNDLLFMGRLVDYLKDLNHLHYLSTQQFPELSEADATSKTAYEGQSLADDQVVWRHVHVLLSIKDTLNSFTQKFFNDAGEYRNTRKGIGNNEIGKIKKVTNMLDNQLVGSLISHSNG
ncbi:hypothetical protein [Endozoicomonas montiporae]|uniref:hypothetical protein n=1 Tax=Endozoicomonas montiporae TaxID=1027273 RepID=UPI0011A1E70A|nr:hypothetical protein [Endozoicomonas montiporae]